jgi:C4-dicarboxylate-specific signal transduction histidine kinase
MDRALTAGAMSSSIAHELNQPLTAIMNNAEAAAMLLNADPLDREELKAIVSDIRRDDGRAADIIKHLRMLLRQSELKPENLILNDVLADSVGLIEGQANDNGVSLQTDIPATTVRVRADYVHLQQVILNLALNAIEAMRAVPSRQRLLQVRLRTMDGSKAIVSVADSGPGIPPEKMGTIFNPFVTTKAEGTGLGLSIAHTILHTYGGRIWAESNVGQGAVFHFSLNIVPATEIPAKAA